MRISSQEYWSGFPFLSAGYLPHPGIEPLSPALADGLYLGSPSWWAEVHDSNRANWSLASDGGGTSGGSYVKTRPFARHLSLKDRNRQQSIFQAEEKKYKAFVSPILKGFSVSCACLQMSPHGLANLFFLLGGGFSTSAFFFIPAPCKWQCGNRLWGVPHRDLL